MSESEILVGIYRLYGIEYKRDWDGVMWLAEEINDS
jgi:hypothetical protein